MRRARRMDGRPGLNMAAGSLMRRVLRKFFIVTIWRKRYATNRRVGSYQEVGTYRITFAVISLWGKFGGLHACGDTFPHIVPLPNILLTRLFSKLRLKRKDFQEILRLPWAQEVPSSNLGAPTTYFFVFNELSQILQRQKPNLGPSIASVVPRVQTISSGPRACTNFATVSLAFSYRVADRRASVCKLFVGFALSCR